jgi:hypothetical protein
MTIKERQKTTDMKSVFIVISILLFSVEGYAQQFDMPHRAMQVPHTSTGTLSLIRSLSI